VTPLLSYKTGEVSLYYKGKTPELFSLGTFSKQFWKNLELLVIYLVIINKINN